MSFCLGPHVVPLSLFREIYLELLGGFFCPAQFCGFSERSSVRCLFFLPFDISIPIAPTPLMFDTPVCLTGYPGSPSLFPPLLPIQ